MEAERKDSAFFIALLEQLLAALSGQARSPHPGDFFAHKKQATHAWCQRIKSFACSFSLPWVNRIAALENTP